MRPITKEKSEKKTLLTKLSRLRRLAVLIFLYFIFLSQTIRHQNLPHFIVWNVGQGLWTTLSEHDACYHIDMGGEYFIFNWKSVLEECGRKKNFLYITHGDWDHINFIKSASHKLPFLCLVTPPAEPLNKKQKKWFKAVSFCKETNTADKNQSLKAPLNELNFKLKTHSTKKISPNSWSRIFVVKEKILVSGDSPRKQEKRWLHELSSPLKVRFYILGHHGSNTSSSEELLKELPRLQTAIASARYRKYRHPHPKVVQRLKVRGVNLLKTEDWGNIYIPLQ